MTAYDRSIKFLSNWQKSVPGKQLMACLLVLMVSGAISAPAAAADEDLDNVESMAAVAPLRDLLAQVYEAYSGRVLEVELDREEDGQGETWVYEVKLLTQRGNVLKLEYDAVNLELLKIEGKAEN